MKTILNTILAWALTLVVVVYITGCDDDNDPGPQLTGDSKTYALHPVSDPGISGTVTFAERDDDQVLITIELSGTQATHPAHIHANAAAEGGGIILDLNTVTNGKSETVVNALNDGTTLAYDDLLALDGYVNVHLAADNLAVLVAQGDIGQNELSGESKVYNLDPVSDPEISGTATFARRVNGETLVTVLLQNTAEGESFPSHIHTNSAAEAGGIVVDLSNIDGSTGMARTNVSQQNDGTPITYEELLAFDGHLNVHASGGLIAQGDIGGNELTGDEESYTLNELNGSGVSGTATFSKRQNGKTLVILSLTGTSPGATHPAHIHANDAATGGGIVVDLSAVNGISGRSATTIDALNDGTAVTYDQLVDFNGHINVHLSPENLATRVATQDSHCGGTDGRIEVRASGGSGAYRYRLNGSAEQADPVFANLGAGTYTVSAFDANDCSGEIEIAVKNLNGLNISFETQPSGCGTSDGGITVEAFDGVPPYRFKLGNAAATESNTFTGLTNGTYDLMVTDAAGCEIQQGVMVTSGVKYAASIAPIIQNKCAVSGCHNGSQFPDFRVFKNIHDNAGQIKTLTGNGTMPQNGTLTQAEKSMIACWVDDGALNN